MRIRDGTLLVRYHGLVQLPSLHSVLLSLSGRGVGGLCLRKVRMQKAIEDAHIHEVGCFPIGAKVSKEGLGARNVVEVGQACVHDGHESHDT